MMHSKKLDERMLSEIFSDLDLLMYIYDSRRGRIISEYGSITLIENCASFRVNSIADLNKAVCQDDLESLNQFRDKKFNKFDESSSIEYRIQSSIGSEVHLRESVFLGLDTKSNKNLRLGYVQNISDEILVDSIHTALCNTLKKNFKYFELGKLASCIIHELNNQLSLASIYITKLDDLSIRGLASRDREFNETLKKINTINKRMISISRDITSLYLKETTAKDIVDINATINAAINLCALRARNHNVEIIFEENSRVSQVYCNAIQIQHVLINIINNALDALVDVEDPVISIQARNIDEGLEITVSDNGGLLNPSKVNDIFDFGVSNKSSGVGLYLCKKIVKEHHGKLFAESELKKTKFTMVLPAKQQALEYKKILVVDDEPEICEIFSEIISESGYKPYTANSGNEALEIVKNERIDVIFTDIVMPDGDGYDFIKKLNFLNPTSDLPDVYLMSGYADFGDWKNSKYSIKGAFVKPLDLEAIKALLNKPPWPALP